MLEAEVIEFIVKQKALCKTEFIDKFLKQKDYYKDKYIHLVTVVLGCLSILVAVVTFSVKQSNDIAVLKDNVMSIKKLLKAKGHISYSEEMKQFYLTSKE